MMVNLSALGGAGQQFFDNNGNVLTGGKLWSYQAGTTTPQTTYTSASGATAHTNPIVLDSAGRVTTGEIWVTAGQNYKFVLMTSTNVTIATWDNITGINGTGIPSNANNVEYDPPFTGALTSNYTVEDKLAQTVSVKDFGAVSDGVTNDSAAFIAARTAAAGKRIYAPAGHYKLNQSIISSEDLILEGDGPSTILDFTGTVTGGSYALDAIGTATQIQDLGATATVGTSTVTFTSAPSLAVGDVFVIFNPTNSSWSGFRTNYFAGEWCEVASISGNTVTVRNQLYDTYTTADVDVYKISGPRVVLRNFQIRGTTVTGLVNTTLCINPLIENVKGDHANNSVVNFDRCFKPTVINPNISNVGDAGDDYGIAVGNSQHCRVLGGYVYSRRHAITTGGNSEICAVPVRDARFIACILKNDIASNIFTADFHGNTEDSSYIDCTIYGGASWQGKDVEYVNCTITADQGGRVLMAAEIKGGSFGLRGCKLITHVNPGPTSRGIIDVGGNNDAIDANTVLPCTFEVENSNIYGRNLTSSTLFLLVRNRGSSVKINSVVDGLIGNVNALNSILFTDRVSGTADADFIVVDRIAGFPNGTSLHNANNNDYLNFPHRCQKQTGRESLTATAGTNITVGATVDFKYPYPRPPSAQAGGETSFAGNVSAIPCLGPITANNIAPRLISATAVNWASSITRTVYWSAEIDEV